MAEKNEELERQVRELGEANERPEQRMEPLEIERKYYKDTAEDLARANEELKEENEALRERVGELEMEVARLSGEWEVRQE